MANGLFAEYGLAVELLHPDMGPQNVKRVSAGEAEFCLTSPAHYLGARAEVGELAARFVAVLVQRHPMAAVVAAESSYQVPIDLAGRRVGGAADGGLIAQYKAVFAHLGLQAPVVVPMSFPNALLALTQGDIDAVPHFVDGLPRMRRRAGVPLRAVPFGLDIYGSGLVASDRLPLEAVERMREAVIAAFEHQRANPEAGLVELSRRYPDIDPADALEGWSIVEQLIFTGVHPGLMEPQRWELTVEYICRALGLPAPQAETVYRPDFVGGMADR